LKTVLYSEAAEELRGNPEQWRVYETTGNCVVQAGPGSGKTKTITIKIARLLSEAIRPPRRLACITYSNACVGELRRRLRKLGVADDARLLLNTVHSYCLTELVLPYAKLAGIKVPEPIGVASARQSKKLFQEAYSKVLGGTCPSWFRLECDKLRRSILERGTKEWASWNQRETAVVGAYERLLLANGLIDFEGLVTVGVELVEQHAWVRNALSAKFPVIVIDEYQDLGLPLHRMVVALLTKTNIRVLAVGDPDQSIYGFTGAKPSLLRSLEKIEGVEAVRLRLNYRCADQIIAASRALLTASGDSKSHDGRRGDIKIWKTGKGIREQTEYALKRIVPSMLKENPKWTPGDVVILYRSYREGQPAADSAEALGMRYFRLDNGSPIKRTRLVEWLTDAARWCSGGWKTGDVSLSELLHSWRLMRRSLTRPVDILRERAKLINMLFANRDGNVILRHWLEDLHEASLAEAFKGEPGLADEREIFAELREAAEKGGPLESYTVDIFGNKGRSPDQINLMTLHSSKGLEFESVIMVGMDDGILPSEMDRTQEQREEAGRLFYVGITRAKNQVHLMYEFRESSFITAVRKSSG
jgi:superfamily I DNA/RNA helicase